ncbi:WD repeat-containing protein 44-like [Oppia nitens]|uniref:WD repeat-containing protein 44-like n=1 Tax=Oppia nitens TaxID=1686743 RepID=UPI0023DB3C20|nr:WD repeat-containing protein 44-like [Oppia nitens]
MSDSSNTSSNSLSDDEQFFDAIDGNEDVLNKTNDMHLMTKDVTPRESVVSSSTLQMADSGLCSSQSSDVTDIVSDLVSETVPDVVPKICKNTLFNNKTLDQSISATVSNDSKNKSTIIPTISQPKPPPRARKKKLTNSLKNEFNNTVDETLGDQNNSQLNSGNNQNVDLSYLQTPSSGHSSNLTSILDDIVSIKGDLSLNEAFLQSLGDRRSVCIDEIHKQNRELVINSDEFTASMAQMAQSLKTPKEQEILNQIMILNIDTGERVPLSKAEEILPKCLNPLSLHLMKLTNDFGDADVCSLASEMTAQESILRDSAFDDEDEERNGTDFKKDKLKKGIRTLTKLRPGVIWKGVKGVKSATKERSSTFHVELKTPIEPEPQPRYKIKVNHKRGTPDFDGLKLLQELYDCKGAIWVMKYSVCGQLLAAAGQDHLLRVYCSQKSWKYFTQLRNKASGQQISPNSTKERDTNGSFGRSVSLNRSCSLSSSENLRNESLASNIAHHILHEDNTLSEEGPMLLFSAYRGHTADVLDIAWSKNHFLLSSSMDKTVRLWHITRVECLCTFRHIDFVTTIQFHPRDDRYFLSGSLDGKLRLWNIPDKRVTLWNEIMALPTPQSRSTSNQESVPAHGLITASSFVQNGKFAVIGTYDGRIIFYSTDQLKYFTQIHVSGSGKNSSAQISNANSGNDRRRRRNNNKVTGIEGVDDNKILVTTNDSRLRLYDLRDLSLTCKYRGVVNESSQIKASISHDSKYIICGSENASFYIWRLQDNTTIGQRRDRNKQYEAIRLLPPQPTHSIQDSMQMPTPPQMTTKIVTSAIFAPVPQQIDENAKYVIAVADFNGNIRIFSK